jgi:hypothetical protein
VQRDQRTAKIADDKMASLGRANSELQQRLEEALAERDEVEAQKAALTEVLEVIKASPSDLAPVLDTMLERVMRLCDGGHFLDVRWRTHARHRERRLLQ